MGGPGILRTLVFALACSLFAGCLAPDAAEERARLGAIEAEGRALSQAADLIEDRLMGGQASLEMWAELARRHQSVSALACRNLDEHYEGMVRHLAYEEQRAASHQGSRRRTLAAVDPGPDDRAVHW